MSQGKIFIISAPTGGGKTSLSKALLDQDDLPLIRVITYTTRPRRGKEINGKDYYFISKKDFLEKESQGFFLETTKYDQHDYGSPKSIINDAKHGQSFLMITDRPGALHIKKLIPEAVLIWITLPNITIIAERLRNRGREKSKEALQRRIDIAKKEIDIENREKEFTHHIMNINFDQALAQVKKIILSELACP